MSDLAMYEALASAALARHGKSEARLRLALKAMEAEAAKATGAAQEGLELIAQRMREHLASTWPELPAAPERYP